MRAMEKKRYWLKLDKDFLKSSQIKVIKNMPSGKDYIIFYLSLLLESVETVGHLRFSDLVPYNEDMLASVTDTNVDIVRSAIKLFNSLGLLEMLDDGTIYMTQVAQMTGKESESAERVRQYRLREKQKMLLQCNEDVTSSNYNVTNCNDNKEKEEDKQSITNNEDKQSINNKEEEEKNYVSVSVNDAELLDFFERFQIEDAESRNIIIRYLNHGMSLEVIKNGLLIPFDRNVMNFDFETESVPIDDANSYGFTILKNWDNFGVKTLEDVKKYNKLNRNRKSMIGADE